MPGVRFCEVGASSEELFIRSDRTAAVIIEPLQAEGGVLPVSPDFLHRLRYLCDQQEALLIFDEVQVGLGRTGDLWAHQATGVEPDMMTLAKPLAGGLPMGAVLLRERVAETIHAGDHATTFGGGPLVATAALAVCRRIGDSDFLASVRRKGELLEKHLGALALRHKGIVGVRGKGLIWGMQLETPAAEVVSAALGEGLLLVSAGQHVLRIVPPLTITEDDLLKGLSIIERFI
jgi:acetylornithine/succinyldiaminopimelate/putrescine aminotransferase